MKFVILYTVLISSLFNCGKDFQTNDTIKDYAVLHRLRNDNFSHLVYKFNDSISNKKIQIKNQPIYISIFNRSSFHLKKTIIKHKMAKKLKKQFKNNAIVNDLKKISNKPNYYTLNVDIISKEHYIRNYELSFIVITLQLIDQSNFQVLHQQKYRFRIAKGEKRYKI